MNTKVTPPLSYSSAVLLNNCEQRFWHHKVGGTKNDTDFEEDYSAFNIGKAFHFILESNKHSDNNVDELLGQACKEFRTENEKLSIKAMIYKYLDMHEKSGLECIACELQLESTEMLGYVDAIMVDRYKNWYICDLKTAARWSDSILAKLPNDYQLNLYAAFAEKLASGLKLDLKKFRGCLYRTTTKPVLIQSSKESEEKYYSRLFDNVKVYDVCVPTKSLNVKRVWEMHTQLFERAKELFNGEVPKRNYSYCENYFRPCPYWSNCHGNLNSQCSKKVIVNTAETYNNVLKKMESL